MSGGPGAERADGWAEWPSCRPAARARATVEPCAPGRRSSAKGGGRDGAAPGRGRRRIGPEPACGRLGGRRGRPAGSAATAGARLRPGRERPRRYRPDRRCPPPLYERVSAEDVVATAAVRARRRDPDVKIDSAAVPGDALSALLAEGAHASALVTGSRGPGELTGLLLGSIGSARAARAHCLVIVVRGDKAGLVGRHERILLGAGTPVPARRRCGSPSARRGAWLHPRHRARLAAPRARERRSPPPVPGTGQPPRGTGLRPAGHPAARRRARPSAGPGTHYDGCGVGPHPAGETVGRR